MQNSNSGAGSPTRGTSPTKLLSPRSPPASPTKTNSNSHVVVSVSPCLPASPLKSPLRLPVISKGLKSPPPLLPLNHIRDSPTSSLQCSEDPLTVIGKDAPSENVQTDAVKQQQLNGLSESSIKSDAGNTPVATATVSEKGSAGKFRTPKTPLAPLSPDVDLDPNDYRYMVEEVNHPELRVVVKPSQITRGRGVLTPKKVKIFLRNALHRISEKHPFTVKVKKCVDVCCVHTRRTIFVHSYIE